jgi:hypothetical protein
VRSKAALLRTVAVGLAILLLGLWFDAAYEQVPLYSGNQSTYMLHGLARAGRGLLREDWMARTLDPTPVFSRLVELSYRLLPEKAFYAEHAVLAGLYLFALVGIAREWRRPRARAAPGRGWSAAAVVAALLVGLHARAAEQLGDVDKQGWSLLFHQGVALQDVLGRSYQPSAFGVLLVLSIWLFLRGRPLAAVVASAVAATVHPTYLLSALALGLGYALALLGRGQGPRRAARILLVSGALLLPIALYALVTFRPTSPETQAAALHALVHMRIPHHALPGRWLGAGAYVRIGLVVAALVAVRRSRLFPLLAAPFAVSALLTLVQIVHPDDRLAMLFPWRISVFLVPIASTVLLSAIARKLTAHRFHRPVALALLAGSLVPCAIGGYATIGVLRASLQSPMTAYLADQRRPGQLYLIPPAQQRFRIQVAAPVLIDHKTHPYKDVEFLEWERRFALATRFYHKEDCDVLDAITHDYGLTNVVVHAQSPNVPCAGWESIWEDDTNIVWERAR